MNQKPCFRSPFSLYITKNGCGCQARVIMPLLPTLGAGNSLEISAFRAASLKISHCSSGPVHKNVLDHERVKSSVSLHSFRVAVLTTHKAIKIYCLILCVIYFISKIL